MVVGKTSRSISLTEIFQKFKETDILAMVFPEITSIPCVICSPLRVDKHPSFSIYVNNSNRIAYKDFADGDSGGLLDLLCKYWNCSFQQCLSRLGDMLVEKKHIDIKPKQIKTFTRKEVEENTKVQVAVRPWKDYDYKYWESYGIERKWLKYAEIHPISHKIVTKKGKPGEKDKVYIFPADDYAYVYAERKEGKLSLKIYQPFNTQGYKWCSKMDASVIGLWTKIPEQGEKVVICSSIKDALCLSCQLHIPAICLQGEGYDMSDTAINELKRRYGKIYVCFDTDEPGIKAGKKLSKKTGFINIVPDLGEQKDLSDYYKSLNNKQDFQKLKSLFN